jgi:hypothetical protein
MKKELINIIVSGFPSPQAAQVAQACRKRGMNLAKWGMATNDLNGDSFEVPEVGKLSMVKLDDKNAVKSKLKEEVDRSKKDKFLSIVADLSNNPENAQVFNECKIPFVMHSTDGQSRLKAIEATERAKQSAVITEDFNKQFAAFDNVMKHWSRNFPGLFRGFELSGADGKGFSKTLLRSFNDLFDKDFGFPELANQKADSATAMNLVEGHAQQEYTFKNGSGSSSFTFRRSAKPEEFAEGVADSIEFLAQQLHQSKHPRVFNILDVVRRRALL